MNAAEFMYCTYIDIYGMYMYTDGKANRYLIIIISMKNFTNS